MEKISDYLKDVKLRYADDTENLKKHTNCDDVVRLLHTRLNHMYHTCGIRDTLLFYAPKALRTIQDRQSFQKHHKLVEELCEGLFIKCLSK